MNAGPQLSPRMASFPAALTAGAASVLTLLILGAFLPSAYTWGFHFLAFAPFPWNALIPLVMAPVLVPAVQRALLDRLASCINSYSLLSPSFRMLARTGVLVLIAGALWVARQKTFFLGDGYRLIRDLGLLTVDEDLANVFKHEPLAGFSIWCYYRFAGWCIPGFTPQLAYQTFSIGIGVMFLVSLIRITSLFTVRPLERALLCLLVCAHAGSQLFTGYVENYALAYLGVLLFIGSSVLYLRNQAAFWLPSCILALTIMAHFATAFLLPALVYLRYQGYKMGERWRLLISFSVFASLILIVLAVAYSGGDILGRWKAGAGFVLTFTQTDPMTQAYALTSPFHLLDLANVIVLTSPLTTVPLFLLLFKTRALRDSPASWRFIALSACLSMVFISIVSCEIGMSRDWDMLAPMTLPVILAGGVGIYLLSDDSMVRARALLMVAVTTGGVSAGFVAVNSSTDASIERFDVLEHPALWSLKARATAYEERAIFERNRGNLAGAMRMYEHYMTVPEPGHQARISANMARLSLMLGDTSGAIRYYETARSYGGRKEEDDIELAATYALTGQVENAISILRESRAHGHLSSGGIMNVGDILFHSPEHRKSSLTFYLIAIGFDPMNQAGFLRAAAGCRSLGRFAEESVFLERCRELKNNPVAPPAPALTEVVTRAIREDSLAEAFFDSRPAQDK